MASLAENEGASGVAVEIDIRRTARENASVYFDKAKKLREKIARTREHLKETLVSIQEKRNAPQSKEKARAKKEWYEEKYRFFFSSSGALVIAGKDAQTNESVIKKHTGKDDIVFHADPAGSPFVVIREGASDQGTLSEAATFCASYSRAWQARLGSVDVYWVLPEQVKKTALPGEYVPKGAFMIYGKKNYFKNTVLELGIFLKDGEPRSAPISACPGERVEIAPGSTDRKEVVSEIKKLLGFSGKDDLIDRLLPPGRCSIRRKSP